MQAQTLLLLIAWCIWVSAGCNRTDHGIETNTLPGGPAKSGDPIDNTVPNVVADGHGRLRQRLEKPPGTIRIATFNASLNRRSQGELAAELATRESRQAKQVAEIIQRVSPDVLLVNELDYDENGIAARLFLENYLGVSHNGVAPVDYPYRFTARVNTGVASHEDLDHDGQRDGPGDAFGFGYFPGQYGMAVYSRYPIDQGRVRTFQRFLWKDMPGAKWPRSGESDVLYYDDGQRNVLRLSSKSHWDVPVTIATDTIHFLVCHPTPPVFDGPEDRNGKRNYDEIRFFADYISPQRNNYVYDDQGRSGGLNERALFVIAGDLNADPNDGDSVPGAISQLLDHQRIGSDWVPSSEGGVRQAELDGQTNATHAGDPAHDTADFSDDQSGNLRTDYVLASRTLRVVNAGVYWPLSEEGHDLVRCSDHRMVWIDVTLSPALTPAAVQPLH